MVADGYTWDRLELAGGCGWERVLMMLLLLLLLLRGWVICWWGLRWIRGGWVDGEGVEAWCWWGRLMKQMVRACRSGDPRL